MSNLTILSVFKIKDKYEVTYSNNETRLYLEDTIIFFNIYKSKEIDNIEEIDLKDLVFLAYTASLKYVYSYNVSSKKLKEYLLKKDFDKDIANEAVKMILDNKIINDEQYAIGMCENLIKKGFSKKYIKYELSTIECNLDFIDDISDDVFVSTMYNIMLKRQINYNKYDEKKRKEKIIAYIMSKGHNYEFSKKIITLLGDNNDR